MRRASSRQRLVSWDDFDASSSHHVPRENRGNSIAGYQDPPSPFAIEGDISVLALGTSIQPLSRKRDREPASIKSVMPSLVVSASEKEFQAIAIGKKQLSPDVIPVVNLMEKPESLLGGNPSIFLPLDTLVDDMQLHVLSFLSVSDAREMALVNKSYRHLLHSQKATMLWKEWCQRRWPSIPTITSDFVDLLQLPTSLVETTSPNMPVLMGMAARNYPTRIDETKFVPAHRNHARTSRGSMFRTFENSKGRTVTQYVGAVGRGNRCIRADQPLPRPVLLDKRSRFSEKVRNETMGRWCFCKSSHSSSPYLQSSLLDFFCRSTRAIAGSNLPWRPFVAPYITTNDNKTQVHLTPRFVSYYEVSILPCPDDSPLERSTSRNNVADCVAVGVATGTFHLHSRMPGWDTYSYGYHGDDGGIFHGAGDMSQHFGPSFGQGDTVGCGIDYVLGGIFFTLNGKFLGYGWTDVEMSLLKQDLYPTVGVDTNFPVDCNFGEQPFAFDLTLIVERQKGAVRDCLSTSTKKAFGNLPLTP